MENLPQKRELPKIADLYKEEGLLDLAKDSELILLLNCNPPQSWILEHPYSKTPYIPISKIEYLLTKIFIKWKVEIRSTQLIANSVVVTVRLYYLDPISNEWEWQDGIGAQPLQTDKGFGATDFNAIKSDAVSKAAPSAESYAIKDAAEKLGKLFGKDLNRKDTMNYEDLAYKAIDLKDRYSKIIEDETGGI